MERRQFIRGLCGGIAAWPLAAYAQQVSEPRRIGVLGADATVWRQWTAAFVARLRELGWIAGDNLAIEYRWTEGRSQRVSDIAAEFMRQDVDVIVTYGSAVTILKQATTTIPIVFAVAFDPVRSGLVHSLAKPGGNVTGMSIQQPDLVSKRLEILREVIPELRRLAILANAGYAEPMLEADRVKSAAQALGLEAARLGVWGSQDITPALEALKGRADALYVVSDALIAASRTRIIRLALDEHLPTIFANGDYVEAGGLILPMDRTTPICSGGLPIWSTKFCVAQIPATFRLSSRPSSILRSTLRRRQHSASLCRRPCSPPLTRSSNEATQLHRTTRRSFS